MNLPLKYVQRMKALLGENEFLAYEKSLKEARVYGLRVNTMKIDPITLKEKMPFPLEKVSWCGEGFYYDGETQRPAKHPYYHAGLYYLQEPSAMAPASVLPIAPAERVLDLCAAPGGKTTQLGAKLDGEGVLVANDISPARAKALIKNVELFGITNVIILSETPERLAERFCHYFDKILIDAPCSGEGMFRKEAEIIKSWGEEMTKFCCAEQKKILEHAASMLKPGGSILYSTCTFAPEEDEGAIANFLKQNENFMLIPISDQFGFEKGRPDFIEDGQEVLEGCVRLYPHKLRGEGHFLALLKNMEKPEAMSIIPEISMKQKADKALNVFFEFSEENLNCNWNQEKFQIIYEDLFLCPKNLPDLTKLHVVRSGWHIGKIKKNRFEPSQALAMGLKNGQAKKTVNFKLEDENVIRYLKGESFPVEAQDGWNLIMVGGLALGWGKVQDGRLKNKYLPGWRYN